VKNFDVFISYPRKEKATADAVCATLEAAGVRCWIAPRDIKPGTDCADAIVEAIDNCRVMVLIFSSSANRSKQVHREVRHAFDQEKPVLPFRIEDTPPEKSLAYYMGPVHWLDALTPPLERHLETLAQHVKALMQVEAAAQGTDQGGPVTERRRVAGTEADQRRQTVDAARLAEEEAQRKKAERKVLARADEEQRRQKTDTERRGEHERAFAMMKRFDTVSAVDAFLSTWPDSHLKAEAMALRAKLAEYNKVAASSKDSFQRFFVRDDERTQRLIRTFTGHTGAVGSVAIAPDGRTALSASQDKTLKLWNLTNGGTIRTFVGHTDVVRSVAIAPDGRTAVSAGDDGALLRWELATGNTMRAFVGHTDTVSSVEITPDGRAALSASYDRTLRLWDLASGKTIHTFEGHNDAVTAVAIAPDGRTALSVTDDILRLWDLASGDTIRTFNTDGDGDLQAVAFLPDSRSALSGGEKLRQWDLASGNVIRTNENEIHDGKRVDRNDVCSVAVARDGRIALSGGSGQQVRLWDLTTAGPISFQTFWGIAGTHVQQVASVVVAPDGRTGLSGSYDHTLKLWDLAGTHTLERAMAAFRS
jgi:WD40 repeat protein